MNHPDKTRHFSESRDCPRTRLAETDIGSVDVCDCGMWQLHIGALTLRFAPAAVSELLGLLGQAVAEHSARRLTDAERAMQMPFLGKRGDA
ncbi:MAG TPA: hypothetical protein VMG12_22935 [Polyangiaceae bacterium]|nr:hypothetical protein [Polyangiaceae bacterium]